MRSIGALLSSWRLEVSLQFSRERGESLPSMFRKLMKPRKRKLISQMMQLTWQLDLMTLSAAIVTMLLQQRLRPPPRNLQQPLTKQL